MLRRNLCTTVSVTVGPCWRAVSAGVTLPRTRSNTTAAFRLAVHLWISLSGGSVGYRASPGEQPDPSRADPPGSFADGLASISEMGGGSFLAHVLPISWLSSRSPRTMSEAEGPFPSSYVGLGFGEQWNSNVG